MYKDFCYWAYNRYYNIKTISCLWVIIGLNSWQLNGLWTHMEMIFSSLTLLLYYLHNELFEEFTAINIDNCMYYKFTLIELKHFPIFSYHRLPDIKIRHFSVSMQDEQWHTYINYLLLCIISIANPTLQMHVKYQQTRNWKCL